ncbi:unnamed protein product, partial [Mesorhabditis spiculigera]
MSEVFVATATKLNDLFESQIHENRHLQIFVDHMMQRLIVKGSDDRQLKSISIEREHCRVIKKDLQLVFQKEGLFRFRLTMRDAANMDKLYNAVKRHIAIEVRGTQLGGGEEKPMIQPSPIREFFDELYRRDPEGLEQAFVRIGAELLKIPSFRQLHDELDRPLFPTAKQEDVKPVKSLESEPE